VNTEFKIDDFSGEYRWLSNFFMSPVEYEGIVYPSSEHAFQAAKTKNINERVSIFHLPTPGQAKRRGREIELRSDWDEVKFSIMKTIVRNKFANHSELKEKLIATKGIFLEEGNTWGDKIWGTVEGKGENHLGRILMEIRDEF